MKKITLIFAMVVANFSFAQLNNGDLQVDPSPWDGVNGWKARKATTALEWEVGKIVMDGSNAGGTGGDLGLANGVVSDPFFVDEGDVVQVSMDVTSTSDIGNNKAAKPSFRLAKVGAVVAIGESLTAFSVGNSETITNAEYTATAADALTGFNLVLFYGKNTDTAARITFGNIQITVNGQPLSKSSYDLDKLESPVIGVYNTAGAKVGNSEADTENLPNGLYILQLENGATKKISIVE